jgi:hypothetical protein
VTLAANDGQHRIQDRRETQKATPNERDFCFAWQKRDPAQKRELAPEQLEHIPVVHRIES